MALASAGAPTAFAATLTVLVDTDNNAASGCTVATANGPFGGVERRFVTTVDTTQNPPQVTGITQENCTAAPGTLSAPVAVSAGGWPVGVGNGTGGYNMIETGLPISVPGPVRVAVIYSDPAIGADAVTVGVGGGPIILFSHAPGHIEQVPTLSDALLALLVGLMLAVGWRYGRRHLAAVPLVFALVMVTSIAWAAILLDGLISDWSGIPPAATDSVDAPPGADISAVFGTIEGATLFVRVDARTGMPPAAVADAYTAVSGVPLAIVPPAGLLDNDNRGIPAATVTSFGGGSVGGSVTTNAASGTALFGVGGSLTVNAAGGFTYTPAAGFTGAFTFSYRITSVNGTSDALVTINTQQAPAITSANAATFQVGTAGSFTVTATGFPTPTLSMSGALPAGVTFNAGTGVLSGTPTVAGSFPLVFTAANGVAPNATQNFTLTVNQTVAITSANAATFTAGSPGTFTITTSATPVANSITITGALPAGVTLGVTSGTGTAVLSGTPAALSGGTYTVTITASNGGVTPNGTQTFTLTVNEAPLITSANAATFQVGAPGTHTVTATGFPAPTFSMTGALPAGVTFNPATGVLSGTPTAAGSFPLVFTAANGVGANATQNFTLTVNQTVAITSANAATFTVGAPGSFTITTSATPTANLITITGALPAGVSLGATSGTGTAVLSGTPGLLTGGTYTVTITASNGGVTPDGTQTFTLTVNEAPQITSANLTTFSVGQAGNFAVTATGFPAPNFTTPGPLPTGVTLNPTTGALSGTPGAGTGGIYPFTITAANGVAPDAAQNFTLTVNQAPAITSANATTFTVGSVGSFTVTATGVPGGGSIVLSATGALPGGVSFVDNNNGTATLSGMPALLSGGVYPLTITASNGVAPNATQSFTLTVNQAPAITSAAAVTFSVGTPGTFTVTTTGFPTGASMVISQTGALPTGVTFVNNNDGTATLAGTPGPGTQGPYPLTITANNGVAPNAVQPFTLTVNDPANAVDDAYNVVHDPATPLVVVAPGILANDTGTPAPAVTSVTGNGAPCIVFPCAFTTANGNAFVQADGHLTYTPNSNFAGTDTFTYTADNGVGSDTATVTITVTNALPVVDLSGAAAAGIDFAATYTEGSLPVPIVDPAALTVADTDDTHLTGATIVITNLLDGVSELLAVTCSGVSPVCEGAIQVADVTYTAATGTLEILATAPLADYQTLLRTLTYVNASVSPTASPRDVTVTINDGIADNLPVAHAIVTIAGVNGDPVITAPATATTPVNTARVFAGTVSVADPDAGGANVQVTLAATNGTVALSGTAGLTVLGNGTATVTSTGPIASQNAALNGMSFTPGTGFTSPPLATLQIDISDLGNTGSGGAKTDTHTVNITVDTPPAVTTTIPVNGATGVSSASTITVNFTENVTVTGASFTINCSVSGARPFSFAGSGTSQVILTPNTALPAGETCTVTVIAAQVTDSGAQNPAADYVFSFTVNTLPTVTSTVPTNGATGLALGSTITINFSEPVAATGSAFTLECPAATPIAFTASASPAASYTLTPGASLPPGTLCAVNVVAAQITDVDGGQNMAASFPFSFTTGVPPAITSANNATFTVGTAGNFTVTTTGTPTVSSIVSASVTPGPGGALPSGVTFTYVSGANATLAGTPANAAQVGTYVLSFTASNGIVPNAVQNPFTLTVQCPAITLAPANNSIFAATYNTVFTQAFTPAVGTAPYTYTVGGSGLPPGVAFSGDNLTGTPTNTGSFTFTVAAVDANGCTMTPQNYTINVAPAANADAYNALGNVLVDSSTGTPFTVLTNDSFPVGTGSVTGFSAASAQAGTVSVGANGQFTYNPPVGFTGTDTFTYTLSSNGQTAVGTVTFTVSGLVWFVSNVSGCAVACNGRLTNPYVNASNFNTDNTGAALKPSTDDAIFFYGGGGSYTGAVTLLNGQRVVGQGAAGDLATLGNVTPENGQTLPATGGAKPTLGGTLTVAQNNFVHGVTLAGNTPAISGTNFGTLTINDNVDINTAGAAMSLATGTLSGSLTTTIASGGTSSISLTGVATSGTFGFGGGGVTGGSANGFVINGENGSFSYNGTISNTAGAQVVSITNKTGGTVTLNGDIGAVAAGRGILVQNNSTGANTILFNGLQKRVSSGTSAGVNLDNNDGATISFANGGLEIATTTGAGFSATNGAAAIAVTGSNNVINAANGTGLNVNNSTIGAGGLNFRSISSGAATGNGISLDTTGATAGLTVTGDGTNTSVGGNATGGTISGKSGADLNFTQGIGVYLNNTRNVVLRRMTVNGTNQNFGIRGTLVNGFTLEYSTVNGTQGNAASLAAPENAGEGAIYFGNTTTNGIAGSGSFTSNVIGGAAARNLSVINTAGAATLSFKGNTFQLNQSTGNQALLVEARNGGTTVAATVGGTLAGEPNTFAGAPGGVVNFTGQTGTTMTVTMFNNTLNNTHPQNVIGGGSLTLATQGTMNFDVQNNTMTGANGSAVTLQLASAGTLLSGKFANNTIGTSGVANSGAATGNGIFGSFAGAGTASLTITGNTIRRYSGNAGMYFDNTGGSYTANFTILNNLVDEPGAGAFAGLAITNGAPTSSDTINVCADIKSNDFSAGDPTNNFDIIVGSSGANGGHTFNLPGYAGGADLLAVQNFIKNNNTNSVNTAVEAYVDPPATAAAFTGVGATCPTP